MEPDFVYCVQMTSGASSERDVRLRLQQMLESFVASGHPSVAAANAIEAFLLETFPTVIGLRTY